MKHQRKSFWCGIASIANALECLGIKKTQREIARLCDVNPAAGTDETEMKRALLACGITEIDEACWTALGPALAGLHVWAAAGPVILCVDNDEHWVTVIGKCSASFVVFDPSRNHGVEVYKPLELAARWGNIDGQYYGLALSLGDI
jgi:ABC-type bacteriocin/lantibiotic exporter with double-glycine peptidase domain